MDWEIQEDDKSWVEHFRDTSRANAERPPQFWLAQRAAVRARLASRSRISSLRFALASAAALCVIASGLLLTDHRVQPSPVIESISDQQLLSDVDETISSPLPDALAPVQLIAQDMDRSLQARGGSEKRK